MTYVDSLISVSSDLKVA